LLPVEQRPDATAIEREIGRLLDAADFQNRGSNVDVHGDAIGGGARLQLARPVSEERRFDPPS